MGFLHHVNLVIAIEMEFGVTFTTDEISALQNVGDMKRLLQRTLGP